ncbi:SGNH/GDSL hydrolase family protein [Pararhizobium mangrovi]|uniref:SGNH/GDSL hydrolase family protein n=1 Tax=Pararhizobium mangrovi TaxID=2590452 RepID=UPI0015E851CB|nr:DUF459 domain-containing protein [Pararhizobium mangrovi]
MAPTPAAARSILDVIFGNHQRSENLQRHPPAPKAPRQRSSPRSAPSPSSSHSSPHRASKPAPPPEPKVEKVDNALTILVVGDFMASGLADGLSEAFEKSPGVEIVDRSKGSSGLVRDDYYDWPGQIGSILDETKPSIVVVEIGANDRQDLRIDGKSAPVRSDAWTAAYTDRATALANAVTKRDIPLLWAGVPAFKSPAMSADMLAFDSIFRSVASKTGGTFVDTWDGFTDEDGNFVYTGPDINGQQVRLRGSDGINLTRAGKRKLAFYVEKPARRLLGDSASEDVAKLSGDDLPDLGSLRVSKPQEVKQTEPISLTNPDLDGASSLLGAKPLPVDDNSPRAMLVRDGKTGTPPMGRADDFRWPLGERAKKPEQEKTVQNAAPKAGDSGPHPRDPSTFQAIGKAGKSGRPMRKVSADAKEPSEMTQASQ